MKPQYRRAWDGTEWQSYARSLINLRHGAVNVQPVPDQVCGDAGIECFTMDGCAYQCYAPEEVSDTKKASNAMKSKASRDLKKLQTNEVIFKRLLQGIKLKRWILFCPFLDNKDVVGFTRERAAEIARLNLSILSPHFEAIVHCQDDFADQIAILRQKPINPATTVRVESESQAPTIGNGELAHAVADKLGRAYPEYGPERIMELAAGYISAHALSQATLEKLRNEYPLLWETAQTCISSEEQHLVLLGAKGLAPTEQLHSSVEKIQDSMKRDMPDLAAGTITAISLGTLSDWLIRCPLNFPPRSRHDR